MVNGRCGRDGDEVVKMDGQDRWSTGGWSRPVVETGSVAGAAVRWVVETGGVVRTAVRWSRRVVETVV